MPAEMVTLVDDSGAVIGSAEKLDAHRSGGRLHNAFSICIFNQHGELLLQRRADTKYHFAGLWSNTCCGHPRPGERVRSAAQRRLGEEFGFSVPLEEVHRFRYEAHDPQSGLTEREIVSVMLGTYSGITAPDAEEIGAWCWWPLRRVQIDCENNADRYTPWFRALLRENDKVAFLRTPVSRPP
jgi:isopentenyl-diphosphate delta-isomerase